MIEKRPFGRTGHASTVTLFGAAALARASAAAPNTVTVLAWPVRPKGRFSIIGHLTVRHQCRDVQSSFKSKPA